MQQTTVGQNRCSEVDPTDRPFVVEWDATDTATFESLAQRDVVFVRYENCKLEVLPACNDDGIAGKYGAYGSPKWSSGGVEGFDVKNEYDLYARLPLGAASLSAAIAGGNALHLQYFVSGTVIATRNTVYEGDLAENARCNGATHFVHAYNLGAFELLASEGNRQGMEGGFKGAGGGGKRSHEESRLKQGGDLSSCTSDLAKELARCKVPIRLTLRSLERGENPSPVAQSDHTAAVPIVMAELTGPEQAHELRISASKKMSNGDGLGCLADLDRAKGLDPKGDKHQEMSRAMCEMKAGRCPDGKKRYRLVLEDLGGGRRLTPAELDQSVSTMAAQHCLSADLTAAERVQQMSPQIHEASRNKDLGTCVRIGNDLLELIPKMPEKTEDELTARNWAISDLNSTAVCAAKFGNCGEAKKFWIRYARLTWGKQYSEADFVQHAERNWTSNMRECAGK